MTSLFKSTPQAMNYAKGRPNYPISLYEKVASSVATGDNKDQPLIAIDVGCGTGQATVTLAKYFDQVIGIDPSQAQLDHATLHERVTYHVGQETKFPVADNTVAAITAAQAAHWFDIQHFYREVNRVLKPGGCLALWSYTNCEFPNNEKIQTMVWDDLYEGLLGKGGYWDERRRVVENKYRDIPLISDMYKNYSGERITSGFDIERNFTRDELIGYLRSWSGYVNYCKDKGITEGTEEDPVEKIRSYMDSQPQLDEGRIAVSFPVTLLLCTKNKL